MTSLAAVEAEPQADPAVALFREDLLAFICRGIHWLGVRTGRDRGAAAAGGVPRCGAQGSGRCGVRGLRRLALPATDALIHALQPVNKVAQRFIRRDILVLQGVQELLREPLFQGALS